MKIGRICTSGYLDGSSTKGSIIPKDLYSPTQTKDMPPQFQEWFESIESPTEEEYGEAIRYIEEDIQFWHKILETSRDIPSNLKEKCNIVSNERGEIMINYLNTMKEVVNLQIKKIH
jgi:hypothetical protein